MQPIRHILVAVKDPRKKGCPAVAKAAVLARALDARLHLFHAICQPLPFDAFGGDSLEKHQQAVRARLLGKLEQIAGPLRSSGVDVATDAVWDYPSHEAVVRQARRVRADLIVARRHAGRHVASWFLRYTDWELLRQSPVPLLLVKKSQPWRSPGILAAVDPTHAFDKTAQLDRAILQLGEQIGSATSGALHALHAYVPATTGMSERRLAANDAARRIADEATQAARKRLDKTLRSAGLGKLPAGRRHVIPLHPINSIPGLARQLRCDIVVMGAISRSGLKGLVIGNTAERLLDGLATDVLVVKPAAFRSRVPARVRGAELYFAAPPSAMP
jgi:universal stress protein E